MGSYSSTDCRRRTKTRGPQTLSSESGESEPHVTFVPIYMTLRFLEEIRKPIPTSDLDFFSKKAGRLPVTNQYSKSLGTRTHTHFQIQSAHAFMAAGNATKNNTPSTATRPTLRLRIARLAAAGLKPPEDWCDRDHIS